jgi:predicted dithiol-disulfide oxidoreductase (DUF899 family)
MNLPEVFMFGPSRRGVEAIGTVWSILDRTPLGRQEEWEDTPEGRPQGPKFEWWRLHDRYENSKEGE